MTKGRVFGIVAAAAVLVVMLAASSHASAGSAHEAADCVACSLCDWLSSVLS